MKKTAAKKTARQKTNGPPDPLPEAVLHDVDRLRSEWRKIVRLGRAGEHAAAKYMSSLFALVGEDERQFQSVLVSVLEESSQSRNKYLKRIAGYKKFPLEALWKAVSWKGIDALVNNTSHLTKRQLQRAVKALMNRARRHSGVIPNGALSQAFAEVNIALGNKRGPSSADLKLAMLVEQIQKAVEDELLSRGLLRQIFTEDALKILNLSQPRVREAVGVV